ncbi:fatty acid desaturase [Aliiroseovarius subalbicans]|uniref:fatty acid desaturase family protein n=1 Tax=Aliiroseovarius subalbicans TaxID=2925840 RepID=UPI001F592EAA|nr:fatty acid desaturase [Aliiroseovarius subalbicans]MCI2398254.1 fatty acid desaturase [Aliiroseovarius subalbicans]
METGTITAPELAHARDWVPVLAKYREADDARAWREVAVTLGPFLALWVLAWGSLDGPRWVTLALTVGIGLFLMRLFALQHDCGHAALFRDRRMNDRIGRLFGVLTLSPYTTWRKMHATHHENSGNLDGDFMGDLIVLTVDRYRALDPWRRLAYRIYRNPLFIMIVSPPLLFYVLYRIPVGLMGQRRYWASCMVNNGVLAVILGAMYFARGWEPILWIFIPSTLLGAVLGIWIFYCQHQWQGAQFDFGEDWQVHEAALHGSSQLLLPGWMTWFTANFPIHHVHHLYARIPSYRLPEVLRDHPQLEPMNKITVGQSLAALNLALWDPTQRRLISFREAHGRAAQV